MSDDLAGDIARVRADGEIRALLDSVCQVTSMGFAAVARVTDTRWVAAQVLDKIEFGLEAGDELELKTTICDEIRQGGQEIVIDNVRADPSWRTHHTPVLYGFESYISYPIVLADGSFWGTLCAIDPEPRQLRAPAIMALFTDYAARIAAKLN